MLKMQMCEYRIISLLLGHDQGDAGAVGPQRRTLLAGPAVEHGKCGQRWRDAAVCSRVPQFIRVPVDSLVVVQLNSAAHITHSLLW